MTSEIVKKRGRPKKVTSDPVKSELADITQTPSTSRTKSTKASDKKPKPKSAASAKSSTATAPVSKPKTSAAAPLSQEPGAKSPAPAVDKAQPQTPSPALINAAGKRLPITPATSNILSKVRELSQNQDSPPPQASTPSSKIPPTTLSTNRPATTPLSSSPSPTSRLRPTPPREPTPLPPNYKSISRKITVVMVGIPVIIVTGYVLYERLVLGEPRKVVPGRKLKEAGGGDAGDATISSKPNLN